MVGVVWIPLAASGAGGDAPAPRRDALPAELLTASTNEREAGRAAAEPGLGAPRPVERQVGRAGGTGASGEMSPQRETVVAVNLGRLNLPVKRH